MIPNTISGLKKALQCANQEAKNYLSQLIALRNENAELRNALNLAVGRGERLDHAVVVLLGTLEKLGEKR